MATQLQGLSLYGYPQCPYCARVLRALDSLGLEVEFRNTMESSEYGQELIRATGRMTVPVLRIEAENGEVIWMPESAEIVEYLAGLVPS
jgi:glutaredoxin